MPPLVSAAGLAHRHPVPLSRTKPSSTPLRWLSYTSTHPLVSAPLLVPLKCTAPHHWQSNTDKRYIANYMIL